MAYLKEQHELKQYKLLTNQSNYRLSEKGEGDSYFNVEFKEVAPMHPIRSANTYYVRQQLSERIKSSDIVLGIAGIYVSYSEWMEWELDKAIEHGKPILGVIAWGHERVSSVVSNKAKKIVRWNTDSIVDAIGELV